MRVVKIEWIDSCASDINWILEEELKESMEAIKIVSYGVIVRENKECVTIAQNYGFNPKQMCSLMTIPKGCIKVIKDIDNF